jgi:hypothetical protein
MVPAERRNGTPKAESAADQPDWLALLSPIRIAGSMRADARGERLTLSIARQ